MSASEDGGELRRRAEGRLAELHARDDSVSEPDAKRLLHELRVHQIELEMQNEELVASRLETEKLLARYTELFDFAPIGFFHVAGDSAVRASNFAGARLLGLTRGKLAGRQLASFISQRDRRAFDGFLASMLTRVEPDAPSAMGEFTFLASGNEIIARMTGALLEGGEGGALPSALLAAEDITGRRRAEDALRAEARHRDEFLAALSHELRNPLAPIRNALSILQRLPSGSERAPASLAIIDRQVAHLTRVVDDLLDATRIARGKIRLLRRHLELGELVRYTMEDHRTSFQERGVFLRCDIDATALWVEADASRLAQVLGNLLGNALKFTNSGDRVEVFVRAEQGAAVLRVRDSGIGIPPEVQARLFEPFSQGPQSLERSRGGLGLGLSTVKGIVELHDGTVSIASEGPGSGTELVVRLPLAAPPEAAAAAPPEAAAAPRRVLVVEDNADAAESLKDLLELRGHEVRVVFDGQAGLLAARTFRPEVVLCDIGLPGMSGYDFAAAIRSEESLGTPFLVALSGYASKEDARRAAEAGFDRHLAKPVTPEQLEKLLAAEAPPRAR
jgi:two-component system CheB/CheR fusion protein